MRNEVDSVMTTVEARVQDATGSLLIRRVELAMKSANASPGRSLDGNVIKPDPTDFSGNVKSLQMTASSRINSHGDMNKTGETRGN